MILDFFIELNYQSSTVMLFVGIKYFLPDLVFDVSNYD